MKIEDHGFIGNTLSGAIVGINGSIDWLALPRFDSEACFAALLGHHANGHWQICPAKPAQSATQCYRGNTLVLETLFKMVDAELKVTDFMPMQLGAPTVVRVVESVHGAVDVVMHLTIRFSYGLAVPWVRQIKGGITAVAGPDALVLRSDEKYEEKKKTCRA